MLQQALDLIQSGNCPRPPWWMFTWYGWNHFGWWLGTGCYA